MNILELKEKRRKALADAREINDRAAGENRNLTDEERDSYTKAMADFNRFNDDVKREEELIREEERLANMRDVQADADMSTRDDGDEAAETRDGLTEREDREIRAFEHFIHTGDLAEYRALQVDSNVDGGYLLSPQAMVKKLIKDLDNMVYIRQLATTYQVGQARSLGCPSLDSDPDDPEWTTELQTGSQDTGMSFGRRELHPHPVAAKIKVSETMLRSVPSAEALVRARMAYKMAIKHENGFLNGNGDKQPLGLFTASAAGISTSRDVSTGNTTTAITADNLKRVKFSLKKQYRNRARTRWIFHRDLVTDIALLKDGNNRYLLQDDIRVADGVMLLGLPMEESEYAPNTKTASQYVGLIGDLSHYWIADALTTRVKRLNELYAETDQIGFHIRSETDGMPVLEEAFARVKLAAS